MLSFTCFAFCSLTCEFLKPCRVQVLSCFNSLVMESKLPVRKFYSCTGEDWYPCQRFKLAVHRPCCRYLLHLPWEACTLEYIPLTNTPLQYVLDNELLLF